MSHQEQTHIPKGVIGSVALHLLLALLLFFFVIGTPDPPLGEVGGSGIELNYGAEFEEGFGDIQTRNQASDSKVDEEVAPGDQDPNQQTTPVAAAEEQPTPEDNSKLLKSDDPEDVKLDEKVKETKVVTKPEVVKPEPKKETKVVENKTEPTPTVTKNTSENSNGTVGTANKTGGNNNGDRPGKVGDQGNPKGTLDAKALYGNLGEGGDGAGGAGGNRLEMSGWKPLFRIDKKDVSSENGVIVFQIKVDNQGELISVIPIEKSVSPTVVAFYKKQIEENWAVERSRENINPPPVSTGRYTVRINSK